MKSSPFALIYHLIKKDFLLFFMRGGGLGQALLLGLLLIFVFSLSQEIGGKITERAIATLFWLASVFSMVLIFNNLHGIEEQNQAKTALHLMPSSIHIVWFSKAFCGLIFMLISQIFFFLALMIFCQAKLHGSFLDFLFFLLLVDIGMTSCGSLLGALAVGQTGKESLLSIILFPLLTPLLLAGIDFFSSLFSAGSSNMSLLFQSEWFLIALCFDALFIAMALILFPFIYTSEN